MVICIAILLIVLLTKKEKVILDDEKKNDFVFIGNYHEKTILEDNYIFTNYDDFHNKIESDVLSEKDFKDNNYVLFSVMYDQCSESDITPVNYEFEGSNINVVITYTASCGVCAPENLYYLLKISKNYDKVNISKKYIANNNPYCNPNVSYKPLIYVYPEKEMDVTIKLGYENLLTTTYPKYNGSWKVHAYPNGNLIDEKGRTYYGLYWEGLNSINVDFSDGFIVKGSEVASFLEEKLSILGLNEREANEFIIYWLPKLEENKYNLIRFETIDNIDKEMPLYVNPTPDTIIRVLMEYKPLNSKINIKEQELIKVSRKGYTIVEWGGTLIK